ncbi:MAG: amidohydrolase family protein [Sphingobium sp.]
MIPLIHARRGVLAMLGCVLLMGATPATARKKQPDLPPPTTGLVDNINGIAVNAFGSMIRFDGLLIDKEGRVERRLAQGEKRPERLAWRLDGQGKTLIPSFVEGHANVIGTGLALMALDLSEATSLLEAKTKIAAYIHENPGRKWIFGQGWNTASWPPSDAEPTVADLDRIVADTPVWLVSADGRRGWANSAALRLAGLSRISGTLSGEAKAAMEKIVPTPAPKDRDIALDKAQRHFLSLGISTVADIGTTIDDWQAFRRAGDRGALRLRIVGYADGIDEMVTIAGPAPSPWLYDMHLRLVGVNFSVKGATAAADGTRLRNRMSRAAMDGFQLSLSPDDEAAVHETQAAFAELSQTYEGDRRWRTEDMARSSEAPFARLARLSSQSGGFTAALAAMTGGSAHLLFADKVTGNLEPGQSADFLIIDRDLSAATPDAIAGTRIAEHWIGGKRIWKSGEDQ